MKYYLFTTLINTLVKQLFFACDNVLAGEMFAVCQTLGHTAKILLCHVRDQGTRQRWCLCRGPDRRTRQTPSPLSPLQQAAHTRLTHSRQTRRPHAAGRTLARPHATARTTVTPQVLKK